MKEGEDFLRKKGTSKDTQSFVPYQNKPFRGPHKKRGSYRKHPYGGNSSQSSNQSFRQKGGNRTSEAPGVVFDPRIEEGGVETPLPNDSSKASLTPPVGGRLRSFRRDWQTNKCSPNVLNFITNGYILPFLSKPNLVRFPLILSEYKAHQKDQALATCIQSLLSKNAIERVENVKSLGFYSRLFLVTKPHQRWRPVIDLSRLNTFLHLEKFKMETPESIRTSLIPGEWVSSIGLSDAYLHIPIHPNSRKYLRFCYKSHVFQFTSLPFGLATAPQVFTMIVKEVKLMALSRGLRLHQYLDDWLIRSQSQEEAVQVQPSAVNRMVSASAGVQTDLPEVVHTSCRLICHSPEPQTSTVRISCPRPKGLGHRCSKHKLDDLTAYAYPPTALLHKVIQKIKQCRCLIIVIAPGWPGMPWFWDLVQLSTEIPLQLPVSTTLLKQSHKYVFHNNPQQLVRRKGRCTYF